MIDRLLDNPEDDDADLHPSVSKTDIFQDKDATKDANDFSLVLMEENDITAWTQTNAWTELDFKFSTWGDQPTFAAAKGGPGCDSLLTVWDQQTRRQQLKNKLKELKEREANGDKGLWMYLDSGASRSVIQETSPIRPYLVNVSETDG